MTERSAEASEGELKGPGTDHALDVLEFDRVLDVVAGWAASDLGRARVRALRPRTGVDRARSELARVSAALRFVDERPTWGMPPVPDVSAPLSSLAVEGTVLEPLELHRVGVLLTSSRAVRAELAGREQRLEELAAIRERLLERRDDEQAIERAVDAEGAVLDGASPTLKKVRARLRGAHARIVKQLESFLKTLPERFVVPDASVTLREGRYVIPIRREGKGEVGGIVHDESHTGATLFVEPPVAISMMNDLRDLEREESREVRRVLGELTARIAPEREALAGALDALVELDALLARARAARAWNAEVPELTAPAGELVIVQGRHPLLVARAERPVVPFDLEVEPGERAVVVSGPNTGGKSVFLKATGLVAALAQAGVVPPVGAGTRLPVFGSLFADIGDEQSIAHSLSTFSAHLANLREIVERADERSLVLIDEIGAGTDPAEGAALSRAILEELVARRALSLVSSHLGELKRLDAPGSGIVNASLQFDPDRLEPTYRLVKGRPGRSYGLAIARRLGFPARVLDAADGYRDEGEARVEELLGRLERREREADELVRSLDDERATASKLRDEVEARAAELREAERGAERRAREDARRLLLEARTEVEDAIRELRGDVEGGADLDDAAHTARSRVEQAVGRQRERAPQPRRPAEAPDVEVGDAVRVVTAGTRARVREVRSGRAVVDAGGLRLEVPLTDLEVDPDPGDEPSPREPASPLTVDASSSALTEVDLRGLRVDEVGIELARALDRAILEDLSELRIIHGKGTGALRQRVGELLRDDARVKSFRSGGPGEGGAGVTVATFGGGS